MKWESVGRLGTALASFGYSFIPIRKKLTLDNLRRAFPTKSEEELDELARAAYTNVVISLLEIFWLPRMTEKKMREIVSMPDTSVMDARLKEGKGLIMLGGHFGNWELVSLAVGLLGGHPLTIIVQQQRNKYVDEFMSKTRVKFGSRLVLMERAPKEILAALRENKVVAILADQSGPQDGLFVGYFGRPASTHRGPAVFSERTGAPIIMAFIIRMGGGRYKVEFEQVDTSNLKGSEMEKVEEITVRHVAMLEKWVRRYPGHWLWMHKRWKHSHPLHDVPAETSHA